MTNQKTQELLKLRGAAGSFGQDRNVLKQHAELAAALNAEAIEQWDNPAWHREIAATVATALDYGFVFENMFGTYLEVQHVGMFEQIVVRERRGLKVFFTSRGGYIEESQITTENWELPRDTMGFHISEHSDKLQANFAQGLEDVIALGEARMDAEVNRRMFSLLQAAVPVGAPEYQAVASLTPAVLNAAVTGVGDAIKPNGAGPVPITIIGRATAVDQISDFTGYADEALEEIRLKGRLGTYRGANIQKVFNYTDEDGASFIPDNEVWVFGGQVGKFGLYGDVKVKAWEENTVDYMHYRARKDIGGLVHHPEQARRIIITG